MALLVQCIAWPQQCGLAQRRRSIAYICQKLLGFKERQQLQTQHGMSSKLFEGQNTAQAPDLSCRARAKKNTKRTKKRTRLGPFFAGRRQKRKEKENNKTRGTRWPERKKEEKDKKRKAQDKAAKIPWCTQNRALERTKGREKAKDKTKGPKRTKEKDKEQDKTKGTKREKEKDKRATKGPKRTKDKDKAMEAKKKKERKKKRTRQRAPKFAGAQEKTCRRKGQDKGAKNLGARRKKGGQGRTKRKGKRQHTRTPNFAGALPKTGPGRTKEE